jgi:hypothetical protein
LDSLWTGDVRGKLLEAAQFGFVAFGYEKPVPLFQIIARDYLLGGALGHGVTIGYLFKKLKLKSHPGRGQFAH